MIGIKAIQPDFRTYGALPANLKVPSELWLPVVVLLALAGILLLVSALPSWGTSWLWRPAVLLAAIGVAIDQSRTGDASCQVATEGHRDRPVIAPMQDQCRDGHLGQ